jgi:hypothetical protein
MHLTDKLRWLFRAGSDERRNGQCTLEIARSRSGRGLVPAESKQRPCLHSGQGLRLSTSSRAGSMRPTLARSQLDRRARRWPGRVSIPGRPDPEQRANGQVFAEADSRRGTVEHAHWSGAQQLDVNVRSSQPHQAPQRRKGVCETVICRPAPRQTLRQALARAARRPSSTVALLRNRTYPSMMHR